MKLLTNTKLKMNKTSHKGGAITEQCQPHKLDVPSDNLCLLANGYLWWFPIQISAKHNIWKMRDKDLLVCEERQPPNGDKFCCLDFWPHIAQPFFGLRSETSLEASKKVFFSLLLGAHHTNSSYPLNIRACWHEVKIPNQYGGVI